MEMNESEDVEKPKEITGALERELATEKKRNEDLMTRLKYAQADLENYRKRTDKELREASDSVARGLLSRLLVVQDELELAAKHSEKGERGGDTVSEGIGMVMRNFQAAMESAGLQRIECVGKPFDPAVHEAVEKVQGKSKGRDMVVEEIRAGYTFRGSLLRPSMVKVELASETKGEEKEVE